MKGHRLGTTKQKIIISLTEGMALSLSGTPRTYFRFFREIYTEWKNIDQRNFSRSLKSLSDEKLIDEKRMPNGSFKLILTSEGKKIARLLEIKDTVIQLQKPRQWDGKWRIVIFDIPEKDRLFRDILREHLYNLDFFKLQHSVFISPYPFEDPILKLIKIYSATKYVRVITATKIDNQNKIEKHFFT